MKTLPFIKSDPFLEPYSDAIYGRFEYAQYMEKKLTCGTYSLSSFASGYMYFGLHKTTEGWVFREWAPNATAIYLVGDFNGWKKENNYLLHKLHDGTWEIRLSEYSMNHGQHYKLLIEWDGGSGERVPAWATRVVQDASTYVFSAQVWNPVKPYVFKNNSFVPPKDPLLIYECHIGMSSNEEKISTYDEFRRNVLPRIKKNGYNCIQIMAIQEHPYYGSFGYHVSSFFAASSRFGTPEELKGLIDEAHGMGIAVIMDLVHSHAVKNETEGLGRFDGTPYQYFHGGSKREHPAWDSLLFDYGKPQVMHFLLSNCKYWLEEYCFDGFRFDGVTSMIYKSHGLGENFDSYDSYYNMNQDGDAVCYLTLANKMIHQIKPNAITIAEEMSGMPGIAVKVEDGGIGFDYRLAMGIPDFWIKYIKEVKIENWKVGYIFWELTNRRADEKTISYAESHDQAMVGDKTIIFRLIDSDMYFHMQKGNTTLLVDRGVAWHKIIRLITLTTMNGGYLNFMGNEFGHPEWIDFPREGNGWSHKYARRQWDLVDNENLLYRDLGEFDKAMLNLVKSVEEFNLYPICKLWDQEEDQILAYRRGKLVFVFNFSERNSYTDYAILADQGAYRTILSTDNAKFGGFGLVDEKVIHFTVTSPKHPSGREWLQLYIPARTAIVLQRQG